MKPKKDKDMKLMEKELRKSIEANYHESRALSPFWNYTLLICLVGSIGGIFYGIFNSSLIALFGSALLFLIFLILAGGLEWNQH